MYAARDITGTVANLGRGGEYFVGLYLYYCLGLCTRRGISPAPSPTMASSSPPSSAKRCAKKSAKQIETRQIETKLNETNQNNQ